MTLKFVEYQKNKNEIPEAMILLLHGYGSNAKDLISLAPELSEGLSKVVFISPNAPQIHDSGLGEMYQWYSLMNRSDETIYNGACESSPILEEFVQSQLSRFNIKPDKLIVCGFSQGGMMTLHTFLRFQEQLAGIISFSGYLSGLAHLEKEIKQKPKTLLIHGDMDDVVPPDALYDATNTLKKLHVPVESHMLSGLSHGINFAGIRIAKEFVKKCLSVE